MSILLHPYYLSKSCFELRKSKKKKKKEKRKEKKATYRNVFSRQPDFKCTGRLLGCWS